MSRHAAPKLDSLGTSIGVAAVPPSAFYLDRTRAPLLARFCFAKSEPTLREAADRLGRLQDHLARHTPEAVT
jgi:aspartate/methionine/tyrosine aminotransferase